LLPIPLRLERIATPAREYPDMACTTLAHHLEVAMLERAFQRLNPQSAPGVDRVTWRRYKENLEANLETLHEKRVTDTSSPQAVVRRLIPKGSGKLRPLGLPALEDKSVAKAVAILLESIYEQDFYDCSHGFRPGRRPPQALHEVRQGLLGSRIGQVIDCDISSFCDNLEHDTLLAILRKRVKDGRVLKLIETWLKAGILDGKEMVCPDKGSPQGSVISPLLANVYLHDVLDTWFETVVKVHCRGRVVLGREYRKNKTTFHARSPVESPSTPRQRPPLALTSARASSAPRRPTGRGSAAKRGLDRRLRIEGMASQAPQGRRPCEERWWKVWGGTAWQTHQGGEMPPPRPRHPSAYARRLG
jgi:retron-type reverse transcriptase